MLTQKVATVIFLGLETENIQTWPNGREIERTPSTQSIVGLVTSVLLPQLRVYPYVDVSIR